MSDVIYKIMTLNLLPGGINITFAFIKSPTIRHAGGLE